MGPKPIQDVAPPTSGPEIVGDIPVRVSAEQPHADERPLTAKDDNLSPIAPATLLPTTTDKDKEKSKNKDTKLKPTLAIVVAVLAIICLSGGVYLRFFSSS